MAVAQSFAYYRLTYVRLSFQGIEQFCQALENAGFAWSETEKGKRIKNIYYLFLNADIASILF